MSRCLPILLIFPFSTVEGGTQIAGYEPASSCPALFGDAEQLARNHARRVKLLRFVVSSAYAIDIVHSARWKEPLPIEYEDLELQETLLNGSRPAAVIELERESLGCPPGRYVVREDHNLGRKARVLAILPHVVLIEREGRLRYLSRDDPEFTWRMTWASPWEFMAQRESRQTARDRRSRRSRRPKRRR